LLTYIFTFLNACLILKTACIMTSNRLRKALILCPILLLMAFVAQAQTKTVSGKILDEKGNPVVGASIVPKGGKGGTTTDATGHYSLSVPASTKTVVVTFVGYAPQEMDVTASNDVSVSLKPENSTLTDVVVIGYGTATKKDVTGSVASLKAKNFNQGVINAPDQLLQSKIPGVEVTNNNGMPGSATTIKIRGNNSIRAVNNPLYVVDGVPLDGRTARPSVNLATGGFGTTPDDNPLLYINPYDIQQIDVLKDASAAAIYGSRGANGVIVITTKKSSSQGTKLEFGSQWGSNVGYMKKFEVLDAGGFRTALHKYSLDTLSNSLDKGATVDPLKEITQNTLSQTYSLALSGGNEDAHYRASFLGSGINGFIKNSELDKYLGTFSGSYKFLDKRLSIDFGLIAGHVTENTPLVSNTAGSVGNLISAALQWNPTAAFTDANGDFVNLGNGTINPLAYLKGYSDISNTNSYLGNISASYKLLKNLQYKFLYAINHSTGTRATNIQGWLQGVPPVTGAGFGVNSAAALTSQDFQHTLSYTANLTSTIKLDAVAGYEYWKTNYQNANYSALGFNFNLDEHNLVPVDYTEVLQNGKTQNLPGIFVEPTTELQSVFGRVNLNLFDRFFITGTMRADGSSKFGANNKYGYFPSIGGKWLVTNESFMKGLNVISSLAVRGSWGITGNQEFPAGASQEQFTFSAYNTAGQVNVANPDLKWEQTTSYNFGIDYSLLNNRINGSIDYYNKNTTDVLFQSTAIQPAPASIYYINLPANLINKGFEFAIGATIIQKKNFSWDLGFNIANNSNKLTNFYAPGSDHIPLQILTGSISGQGVSGTLSQIITNDQPVNEFYLKPFGGFDKNGNQVGLDSMPLTTETPIFAGDPNPHTIYGVTTTLTFNKLSISANAGGAGGYVIYNNTATSVTNLSGIEQGRNVDQAAYNSAERPSSSVGASTRFLESGNYFKLRNATIRYDFGNVGKYAKAVNVFVSGTNLFVLTKFTGFDPEVNIDKSNNGYPSRSIEYIPYPTPRIITFGFNFTL
jgi:iron complex outermembrane receptor protein